MIAEVHQEEIAKHTTIIFPITSEAKRMALMMNKNLPAFLWHMLHEQGMPEDFVKDLLHKMCKALVVTKMYNCTWNEAARALTTKKEEGRQEEIKAFDSAAWFRDKFSILGNKDWGKKHVKALYILDGNELYKTIHEPHEVQVTPVGTHPLH